MSSHVTPWTVACPAPLSMEFSRQKHWSGLPFRFPGHLSNPGFKPMSSVLIGRFFTTEPPGKPIRVCFTINLFSVGGRRVREFQKLARAEVEPNSPGCQGIYTAV